MWNRRVFMTGIAAVAIPGAADALEVDDDDAIRDTRAPASHPMSSFCSLSAGLRRRSAGCRPWVGR
jgi:hypothetical protein